MNKFIFMFFVLGIFYMAFAVFSPVLLIKFMMMAQASTMIFASYIGYINKNTKEKEADKNEIEKIVNK